MFSKVNSIWARSGKGFYLSAMTFLVVGAIAAVGLSQEFGEIGFIALPIAVSAAGYMAFAARRRDKLIAAFRASAETKTGIVEDFSFVYLQEFASKKYTYRLVIKTEDGQSYKSLDLLAKPSWAKEGIEIGTKVNVKVSDADSRFCLVG